MDKNKKLMILISAISIISMGLLFTSSALAEWYPPGGGVSP